MQVKFNSTCLLFKLDLFEDLNEENVHIFAFGFRLNAFIFIH